MKSKGNSYGRFSIHVPAWVLGFLLYFVGLTVLPNEDLQKLCVFFVVSKAMKRLS